MEKLQLKLPEVINITKSLYEKTLYLNKDIDYLLNCEIREYDMQEAGFNLCKEFKLLPDKTIQYLNTLDKNQRHIQIGVYQKNKEFANKLKEAFILARKRFFEANELDDTDILAIKKDAIFVIKKNCINQKLSEFINFRPKNQYLGYLYLNKIEFYYTDPDTDLDIKNLDGGTEIYDYHRDYMIDFIKDLFTMVIYNDRKAVIKYLTDFIKLYRSNQLENGYYRELNRDSFYEIYDDDMVVRLKDLDPNYNPELINKTYNYFKYLVPIVNIFI